MRSFLKTVLLTGLFVGTTDLMAAYVSQYIKTGRFADKMLHYIAGGALGLETSMKGGFWIGALGLLFHYFIAFSFTLLFFLAFPKVRILSYNKYLVGFLYGLFVANVMGFIILPLTPLPANTFNFQQAIIGWSILGIVLGIPIAWSAHAFYDKKTAVQ